MADQLVLFDHLTQGRPIVYVEKGCIFVDTITPLGPMYETVLDIPVSEVYRFITLINICLTGLFSVLFLTLKVPNKKSLHAYRQTRYAMTAAYLIVAVFNTLELLETNWSSDGQLMLLTTLVVSNLQIFLLSSTLITLINANRFNNKRILLEITPTLALSITSFWLLFTERPVALKVVMSLFFAFYFIQYIRYNVFFWKQRGKTIAALENYFAATISIQRINWITVMFIWIMLTGIMALFSYLLPTVFMIPFNITFFLFYLFFGIYHLNYLFLFPEYESVFAPEEAPAVPWKNHHPGLNREQLDKAVANWEAGDSYLVSGLTIEDVATQLHTNRTYLSGYVNQQKGVSFKEWVTRLRIERAKKLLIEQPSVPVSQIGVLVGLPDKSNFGRQFTKVTGLSPLQWRNQQLA